MGWKDKLADAQAAQQAAAGLAPVEIVVIVDASGSMDHLTDDTIGGFNRFLADQQALANAAPANLTVVQFETSRGVRTVVDAVPIETVTAWTRADYVTGGGTNLLDAVGETLAKVAQGTTGLAVIITDGEENSSSTWNKPGVKQLVEKIESWGWTVQYFGANVDAFTEARAMGVAGGQSVNVLASAQGTWATYGSMSSSTSSLRTTGHATAPSVPDLPEFPPTPKGMGAKKPVKKP